ncbi:MAG: hypothetical protein U9O56_00040 [Campylobacterota bacterium]|nr:hypothetical protein [Campylobacterota bacterium]
MNILEELSTKLNHMTIQFKLLIEENKRLKKELDDMKNKDDLATRDSQDMLLAINNKLKEQGQL